MAQLRPATLTRQSILVVEDQADVREGLIQLFDLHGYGVAGAATGEEALAVLCASPRTFGLVLLDLALPGRLSGYDVRARQLADPALARMPTIVITACEPADADRLALRTDGWVEKPFRFATLLAAVKSAVGPRPAGRRAAREWRRAISGRDLSSGSGGAGNP